MLSYQCGLIVTFWLEILLFNMVVSQAAKRMVCKASIAVVRLLIHCITAFSVFALACIFVKAWCLSSNNVSKVQKLKSFNLKGLGWITSSIKLHYSGVYGVSRAISKYCKIVSSASWPFCNSFWLLNVLFWSRQAGVFCYAFFFHQVWKHWLY